MSKYLFGDIVKEVKDNVDRNNNPYKYFIAGDHMDTDELHLLRRGMFANSDVGPAFTRIFRPGQVLYGSRRTYLRKVAVADFEGITANTTFVLESQNEAVLLQSLLPFIMQTDRFVQHSIKRSKGSTNPYVLFSDLADYEIDLPNIEQQEKLSNLLWSMDSTRMAYLNLIKSTDELVKSQFIEMFESAKQGFDESTILEVCTHKDDIKCGPFGTQLKQAEYTSEGVPVWGIPQINSGFNISPDIFITPEKANELESFSLVPGDIAMSRKGNVGQCAIYPTGFDKGIIASDVLRIRVDPTRIIPTFLQYQLHHSQKVRNQILAVSDGSVMAGINVTKLKSINIYIPPIGLQSRFVEQVNQSDKSKFEMEQALSELKSTYKRIINENLG